MRTHSVCSTLKVEKDETKVLAAANGAAFLVHAKFSCMYWPYHENVFSQNPDILERVKQDVLLALIKLVLTIYDQVNC